MNRLQRRERGSITLDFLFAFVMVMGFSALLFALSMTLTVVEITQYMTYATARNYFASHLNEARQREQAAAKYAEIFNNPVLRPLFRNGWFELPGNPIIGDVTQVKPEFVVREPYMYFGAGTEFIARVLDFNIPFFGSTATEGDGTGSGFRTFIGSYLGRESTVAECLNFHAQRWDRIRTLSDVYANGQFPSGIVYTVIADDGC